MATQKVSEMAAAVSVADADLVPVVQGGVNKKATVDLILDALTGARVATAIGSTAANLVYAGPATGAAAVPAARSLVAADIPSLAAVYQPVDATLTALAALGAGPGFLQVTGPDTFAIAALTDTQINTALGYTAANAASLNPANLSAAVPTTKGGTGLTAIGTALQVLRVNAGATALEFADAAGGISDLTTGVIPYASSATAIADSPLVRVDANTVALRNGTNAQSFQLYGTYTDASNYERLGLTYTTGVSAWDLQGQAAGTGSYRDLRIGGLNGIYAQVGALYLGVVYPLTITAGFPPNCYIRPGADVMDLGGPSNQFVDFYNGKSYQGGRSKTLTDAGDIGFVRIAAPTADTMVAGHINYTIASADTAAHSVEGQSGTIYFVIRNQNGTVTATPDGTGHQADVKRDLGSIGVCTFKSSIASTNCDFVVNADTTLTFTSYTITWTVVITSGNAVVTAL